jgi:hypothetical protein
MSTDLGRSWCCGVVAALVLAGCKAPAPAGPTRPAVPFQRVYYEPTSGTVGHHMISSLTVYEDDTPAGLPCLFMADGVSYTGELPPGLEMPYGMNTFEGTPYQPGTWQVTVLLQGLHCTQGADQSYHGDRSINVTFNIAEGYYDDDW